jgi:uncharacterized Zn-finger protein
MTTGKSRGEKMSKPSTDDYNALNKGKIITLSRAELPLFCPGKDAKLWCAHPKVYIPIEESDNGEARCPYCGTLYQLIN